MRNLLLDDDTAGHLLLVLALHEQQLRRNGQRFPEPLRRLRRTLTEEPERPGAARSGQERPTSAGVRDGRHDPTMTPGALTYAQAGAQLGVSARTVRRLVAQGTLPALTVGRSRRVAQEEVDARLAGSVDSSPPLAETPPHGVLAGRAAGPRPRTENR